MKKAKVKLRERKKLPAGRRRRPLTMNQARDRLVRRYGSIERAGQKLFGMDPMTIPEMTAAELEALAGPRKKRPQVESKARRDLGPVMDDEVTLEEMSQFAPDLFEPEGLFDAGLPTGAVETPEERQARFEQYREETKALAEEARKEEARRKAARCGGCGGKRMLSECKTPDQPGFWHGACLKLARARADLERRGRVAEAKALKLVDQETALMFTLLKEAWEERQALPQRKRGKPFTRNPKTRKRVYKKGTFLPTMEVPPSEGFFFGQREGDDPGRIDSVFVIRRPPVYQVKAWEERKEKRLRQKAAVEGRVAGKAFRKAEKLLEKAERKVTYEARLTQWAQAKVARGGDLRQRRALKPKELERRKRIAETPIEWKEPRT